MKEEDRQFADNLLMGWLKTDRNIDEKREKKKKKKEDVTIDDHVERKGGDCVLWYINSCRLFNAKTNK